MLAAMATKKIVGALLATLLLLTFACQSRPVAKGKPGDWISGQALSAKIDVLGSRVREPVIELRNDSTREVVLVPVSVTVVYEKSGRRQMTFHTDEGLPEKLSPGAEHRIDSVAGLSASEKPTRIQVDVGPLGSEASQRFVAEF